MEIAEQKDGNVVIIEPAGRLDSANAMAFEKTVLGVLDRGDSHIVVDFSKLDYISSAGLRVLLMGAKRAQAAKGKVALCALKPNIREVFEVAGFLSIFSVYGARAEAAEAVR